MRFLHGENYILYEIYDCVLQYVQLAANSHNFQTNINLKLLILTMSYALYSDLHYFILCTIFLVKSFLLLVVSYP